MYCIDTLLAIDETYKRWANILDALKERNDSEAWSLLHSDLCPLCRYAGARCEECPVVIEFEPLSNCGMYGQQCGGTRVFRAAYDGIDGQYGIDHRKSIRAVTRMLWLLDCLWNRVYNKLRKG